MITSVPVFPLVWISLIISGCSLTPEYQRPQTDSLLGEQFVQHAQASFKTSPLASPELQNSYASFFSWWAQFDDPVLDSLVKQALKNNYDLRVAAANILESEAMARAAFGNRLPSIDGSVASERSFFGTAGNSNFGDIDRSQRIYTTTYRTGINISWQTDLFGRLQSSQKAFLADLDASHADRDALIHTIIANVIRQRVALAIAIQRLEVGRAILESRQNTLNIVNRRYHRGVRGTTAVGIRLARENVYSATASIATLEQNVALSQHALDILLGQKPAAIPVTAQALASLPKMPKHITGVPAQLLDRRPDLKASEFRVIASNERIGVALADLYPDLTITARGGWSNATVSDLFRSDSLFGSLLAELTQTLFHGGSQRAEVDAARARLQAQANTYASDVLQAVREVEDALIQNHKLAERMTQVTLQTQEARIAETLSRNRYARGVEQLLTVLETERRRQDAEDSLLQVQQDYWNARIDLHLAIGGEWLDSETKQQLAQAKP